MADPSDLLGAWRELAQQMRGLAGSIAGQAGQGIDVLGALQRQGELIEQVLKRQLDIEQDLVRRALAPAEVTLKALDGAPDAMRAQAGAFRAAATSFSQAADLLELQATALEQTLGAVRAPVDLVARGLRRKKS